MANQNKKSGKAQKNAEKAAKSFVSKKSMQTDPGGSYTGHPQGDEKVPVQDADDL